MNRTFVSGLFVLFLLAGCSSLPFTEGTYVGSVFNGSAPTPAVTTFFPRAMDEQKTLYGSFLYEEKGDWVPGTISDCTEMPERRIACLWHDKYGFGVMQVQFDVAYRSFEGNWVPASKRKLRRKDRQRTEKFVKAVAQNMSRNAGTKCARADLIWNGARASSVEPDGSENEQPAGENEQKTPSVPACQSKP
ncbi:MAG: hypothetical protein LBK01_03130 [Burkholderiaceae bacterium]|jgi:hypothetical protein|nr:hypothetical protein [Burkholderiaceae bacterium]